MIELSVNNLEKYFGATKVFEKISFDVKTGERVGLIGPNGCGKSTLLKMIMGTESYKNGTIAIRKGQTISYLNQIPVYDDGLLVEEVMTLAYKTLLKLKAKLSDYEAKFALLEGDKLDKALLAYGELCNDFELKGGYEIETNLNKIATGLNIDQEMRKKPYELLSGGEKTRIELAKILLEKPDILMLDEPSNHLDMTSIDWLEEYLKAYTGSVIVVSHDRYFLDRVVNRILEMKFDRINQYNGNYSYYVVEKERRFLLDMKYYENQQKKINRMEEQIKRYRIWGEMRDSEKMYKKAQELEKRLEKIEKLDRPVFENKKVKFKIDMKNRSGKRVLDISDLDKGFIGKELFNRAGFHMFYGESAGFLGDNGTGKSTLFKMIMTKANLDEGEDDLATNDKSDTSEIPFVLPDRGEIKIGSRVKIGYLPQEIIFKNQEKSILEHFQDRHNLKIGEARHELAKVLFVKDDVNKKIKSLSGGEKSRLKLCSLLYEGVNLMLLDEPTNHLDVESREMLEEMLIDYEGSILFISHDRYFIAKLASKLLKINNKNIDCYEGDYNYYLNELEKQKAQLSEKLEPRKVIKAKDNHYSKKQHNSRELEKKKRRLKEIDSLILELEAELERVIVEMEGYGDDPVRLEQLYKNQLEVEEKLMEYYEEKEELEDEIK